MVSSEFKMCGREQEIIALASYMMHKHYCENDVEAVIAQMDDDIVWIGAGENEYAAGGARVAGIFRSFTGQASKCCASEEACSM